MGNIFSSIDRFFELAEARFGRISTMIWTGCILLILTMIISGARFETVHHGNEFSLLSQHPFNFENGNDLQFRILSPLLGYMLFLRGPLFKYFMLVVLAIFLGLIYHYQRRDGRRPSEALGISVLLSFSTLTYYQLYFPAYTDPMSFLLILIFLNSFRRAAASIILLSLMAFNHESNFFLFPFFFLLMVDGNYSMKNLSKILFRFAIAVIPYIIYRQYVMLYVKPEYTLAYYFDPVNMQWTREHVLPNLTIGIFQSFRLAWILPAAAIAIDIYEKRYREILIVFTAVLFVLSQLFIAYDISRLVGFAFPVILISAVRLREFLGTNRFLVLIYAVFVLNLFVPEFCVGAMGPESYEPWRMK